MIRWKTKLETLKWFSKNTHSVSATRAVLVERAQIPVDVSSNGPGAHDKNMNQWLRTRRVLALFRSGYFNFGVLDPGLLEHIQQSIERWHHELLEWQMGNAILDFSFYALRVNHWIIPESNLVEVFIEHSSSWLG